MISPGWSASSINFNASFRINVCIAGLFGSPALAPIGTVGAIALGVPCCLHTGGRAAMIQVEIPASSIALCTVTAERWQVPQPAVRSTISAPCSLKSSAISGPSFVLSNSTSPPPPINPAFISQKCLIYPSSSSSCIRW